MKYKSPICKTCGQGIKKPRGMKMQDIRNEFGELLGLKPSGQTILEGNSYYCLSTKDELLKALAAIKKLKGVK